MSMTRRPSYGRSMFIVFHQCEFHPEDSEPIEGHPGLCVRLIVIHGREVPQLPSGDPCVVLTLPASGEGYLMLRVIVGVAVLIFATTAQAGLYRCTITKAFDGLDGWRPRRWCTRLCRSIAHLDNMNEGFHCLSIAWLN